MLRAEWRLGTSIAEASHHERVVCVLLPFLNIPGVMERIFPRATLSYVSLVPRPLAISPVFSPKKQLCHVVPFLSLHFRLVQAYWSTRRIWRAWNSLEEEFEFLLHQGFAFDRGSIEAYSDVVKVAASQFTSFMEDVATRSNATAVAVYGRGHWTMNASAIAAKRLGLQLYVIERGLLSNSYIVDRELPFTALGSNYRESWHSFCQVDDWDRPDLHPLTESRWKLYAAKLDESERARAELGHPQILLVGQCPFDYNCLHAPYTNASGFVDYALNKSPRIENEAVRYKPHPLSPEEYPEGKIYTAYGPITVDSSEPWEHLRNGSTVCTWNSTLGLEASLLFNHKVVTLDADCHYAWVDGCTEMEKRMYIAFLNDIAVFDAR